jgi:hypothetical protein
MTGVLSHVLASVRRAVAQVRVWFEPPLDADARPVEIREAIIDRVEHEAAPVAGGHRALPYTTASITVVAPTAAARAALQAALAGIEGAIAARLAEIRCSVPAGFSVDLRFAKKPKPAWGEGQRFSVTFSGQPATAAATAAGPEVPVLRIRVTRGRATRTSYTVSDAWVRIGRTSMPTDHLGQPRHNQVVFVEEGDEHGATVGRAHASIRWDADRREYRLFDDGSHNGTRIVRAGVTIPVSPRDPVGVTVRSGDEIQFGTAAVRVEVGGDATRGSA